MSAGSRQITGWHVLAIFGSAFAVIIGVNLVLAVSAVKTFPGLETKNSYVASQSFERDREAQLALGWEVSARLDGDRLFLTVMKDGTPVEAEVVSAILGRATEAADDSFPELRFDGRVYSAPVDVAPGYWNLRIQLRAGDGTLFRQRIQLHKDA